MFTRNIRSLYYVSDKIIIRSLRSRRLDVSGPNPGLDNRIRAFQKEGVKIVDDDVEEFVEQSESDFYKVGEVYNEHVNETLIGKLQLRHHIVKEKYFKDNMPNLLTWSEKEQIRHLATEHPDEWTPKRIAESFPVTTAVVKKLLKFPWKPSSEQRIARHDASAMRNWKELKEGTFDIPEDLRQHFLKFADRNIPPLNKKSIKIDLTQQENLGEFESIVQRCAAKENVKMNKGESPTSKEENENTNNSENYAPKGKKDKKMITLDELTAKIKKQFERGKEVNEPDQIILNTVNSEITDKDVKEQNNEIELYVKKNDNELTEYREKEDKIKMMDYPERIRIPKKAYKKDATYKVNDCYYDHDGKFLYRVMGMTN